MTDEYADAMALKSHTFQVSGEGRKGDHARIFHGEYLGLFVLVIEDKWQVYDDLTELLARGAGGAIGAFEWFYEQLGFDQAGQDRSLQQ